MDKSIFYIESFDLKKGDDEAPHGAFISRKISRLIERRPDILEQRPEWGKYKDWENKQKEQSKETKREARDLAPGPTHEIAEEKRKEKQEDEEGEEEVKSLAKGRDGHVAAVGVVHKDRILMGKRNDNQKWTNPGGHLDEGESPEDGAKRELAEEAALYVTDDKHLTKLGKKKITTHGGKELTVHAFKFEIPDDHKPKPHSKHDPDNEVKDWKWHSMKKLPKLVIDNLHSKENIVLKELGLQKGKVKEHFYAMLEESGFFIKSKPHKYLRKYMRGGEWVYIYHEGDKYGRALNEEAISHLKELSELGDEHAKGLLESTEAHDEEKLKLLRELADLGDEHAEKHLKSLGIDRESERLEEAIVPKAVQSKDPIDEKMNDEQHRKALGSISLVLKAEFDHLKQHASTPVGQKFIASGVTLENVMESFKEKKSIKDILHELHSQMKKLDSAQGSLQSARSEVNTAGGLGNKTYNDIIKRLEQNGVLPEGYSTEHKRDKENFSVLPAKKLQEKMEERKKKEEEARKKAEEEERRALGELADSAAFHMNSMMARRMSTAEVIALDKSLRKIFGKSLKKSDFPYDLSDHGFKTTISSCRVSGDHVELEMSVKDKDGNQVIRSNGWRRYFSRSNGRPKIENALLVVENDARGTVQIANIINQNQRKLMKSVPGGGTVHVHANIDIGGYTWCNQGFSWDGGTSTLNTYRNKFNLFLQEHGVKLKDSDLEHFKEPCHFSAFTNGKKYIHNGTRRGGSLLKLSEDQKRHKNIEGTPEGTHKLTSKEISDGETPRSYIHLGKKFLLDSDWYGTWDSAEETEASKFADAYYQLRERAVKHLSPQYQEVLKETKEGNRKFVGAPETRTPTPRASLPGGRPNSSGSQIADRYIDYWHGHLARRATRTGTQAQNMVINKRRLATIMRWEEADVQAFVRNAPITSQARRRILSAYRERGSSGGR